MKVVRSRNENTLPRALTTTFPASSSMRKSFPLQLSLFSWTIQLVGESNTNWDIDICQGTHRDNRDALSHKRHTCESNAATKDAVTIATEQKWARQT
eukprot:56841-Amphidinium_carterae.1